MIETLIYSLFDVVGSLAMVGLVAVAVVYHLIHLRKDLFTIIEREEVR